MGIRCSSKGLCLFADLITLTAWVLMPDGPVNSYWAASHKSREHVFILEALPLSRQTAGVDKWLL